MESNSNCNYRLQRGRIICNRIVTVTIDYRKNEKSDSDSNYRIHESIFCNETVTVTISCRETKLCIQLVTVTIDIREAENQKVTLTIHFREDGHFAFK